MTLPMTAESWVAGTPGVLTPRMQWVRMETNTQPPQPPQPQTGCVAVFFRVVPWMSQACSPLLELQGDGESVGCVCTAGMSSCRSGWSWLQRRTTARSPRQRKRWRASSTTRHGDRRSKFLFSQFSRLNFSLGFIQFLLSQSLSSDGQINFPFKDCVEILCLLTNAQHFDLVISSLLTQT